MLKEVSPGEKRLYFIFHSIENIPNYIFTGENMKIYITSIKSILSCISLLCINEHTCKILYFTTNNDFP